MYCDSSKRYYDESTCFRGQKSFNIQFIFNDSLNHNIYQTRFYRNYMKNNISKINYMDLVKKNEQHVEKKYRNLIKKQFSWISEIEFNTFLKEYENMPLQYSPSDYFLYNIYNKVLVNFHMYRTENVLFYIFDTHMLLVLENNFNNKFNNGNRH